MRIVSWDNAGTQMKIKGNQRKSNKIGWKYMKIEENKRKSNENIKNQRKFKENTKFCIPGASSGLAPRNRKNVGLNFLIKILTVPYYKIARNLFPKISGLPELSEASSRWLQNRRKSKKNWRKSKKIDWKYNKINEKLKEIKENWLQIKDHKRNSIENLRKSKRIN